MLYLVISGEQSTVSHISKFGVLKISTFSVTGTNYNFNVLPVFHSLPAFIIVLTREKKQHTVNVGVMAQSYVYLYQRGVLVE